MGKDTSKLVNAFRLYLGRELAKLAKDPETKGRVPMDISMSIKFSDGHMHHILPEDNAATELIQDAAALLNIDQEQVCYPGIEPSKVEPPEEIIFHNRQAIGDILTMTAAILDFKKAFPKTRVGVQTVAMHLWDHNPHIDHEFLWQENKDKVLKIGPGFLTNRSNLWNYHMCNAFRMDIENKTGLRIPQGDTKPDIWMTREEYERPPIIEGPYWILVVGGEPGWPAKMYPGERFQEIVNLLPEIKFVQLGLKSHTDRYPERYPRLENVIDFIGKQDKNDVLITEDKHVGIRNLFNLFLHAQGSLGLVSMQMHLSAAFNNPCVVIAGAREPSWFTHYYGHQYVSTDGCLVCAERRACWFCKLDRCPEIKDETTPKCVDIIHPRDVVSAVKRYYEGGRLIYGKKIANTFFTNIVEEPKLFPTMVRKEKDQSIPKEHGFEEWGGANITDEDWIFLEKAIEEHKIKSVLEFGSGLFTVLASEKVDKIVSYDVDRNDQQKVEKLELPNVELRLWNGKILPSKLEKFDMVFVDGPPGGKNREPSVKIASEHSPIVVVHDAGREWERKWQQKYLAKNFKGPNKGGHRCHLWTKRTDEEELEIKARDVSVHLKTGPKVRLISTARGWGGCARSITTIMDYLVANGSPVEFVNFHSKFEVGTKIGREFREWLDSQEGHVVLKDYSSIPEPCDVLFVYADDYIWEFKREDLQEVFSNVKADRKVMMLNYRRGGVGDIEWTRGWDKYMFLNSSQESELLLTMVNHGIIEVRTKVLPPCTILDKFFENKPDYNNSLRLIRHSSQGDVKFCKKNFVNEVKAILMFRPDAEIHLMPGPSFLHPSTEEPFSIIKYRKNHPPVYEFLREGNLFYYSLPKGYMDQGPRVVLEAMASGLPIIADNWGGCKDRVTPETGWLMDKKSDYVYTIKDITPEELRMKGEAARQRARDEFVPERWLEEIFYD
jgi:ADP-heptose:LPS heptosyltransferase